MVLVTAVAVVVVAESSNIIAMAERSYAIEDASLMDWEDIIC